MLSNWESQIKDHCTAGSLSHCVYYGAVARTLTPQLLKTYDVVVTTYNVVVSEHGVFAKNEGKEPSKKKAKIEKSKGLFDVLWKVCLPI